MKRLPNGAGSITKLSGARKKPFMAREGRSGYQRCVGTFETYEQALAALMDYNRDPWNLDLAHITFESLWLAFLRAKEQTMGQSALAQLKTAYNKCESLYRREYTSIKAYDMQMIVDNCNKSKASKAIIKNLFHHLDMFARELDISDKMYSELVRVTGGTPKREKTIFTEDEVKALWKGQDRPFYDSVLCMLYTGFRISELLSLTVDNIDLEQGAIVGGMKTEAGRNRLVPIHHKIYPLVEERVENSDSGYLIERNGFKIAAGHYRSAIWNPIMRDIGCNHTPHECRHTFRSWLDSAGAQRVCVDKIMGHASGNVGEDIYTHKGFDELKDTIELIKN